MRQQMERMTLAWSKSNWMQENWRETIIVHMISKGKSHGWATALSKHWERHKTEHN